jgi:hypothetical protein
MPVVMAGFSLLIGALGRNSIGLPLRILCLFWGCYDLIGALVSLDSLLREPEAKQRGAVAPA